MIKSLLLPICLALLFLTNRAEAGGYCCPCTERYYNYAAANYDGIFYGFDDPYYYPDPYYRIPVNYYFNYCPCSRCYNNRCVRISGNECRQTIYFSTRHNNCCNGLW